MFVPRYHLSIFECLISLKREYIYIYIYIFVRERESMCVRKNTKNEANNHSLKYLFFLEFQLAQQVKSLMVV